MKDNTLPVLEVIEVVDSNPIGAKRHANLIPHALGESQVAPIKLKRRGMIPLLLVNHAQIKGEMCLLLNILRIHPCLRPDQKLLEIALFADVQRD